ncbi:hypothetical protein [Ponticoccus sp. (in: a-proteobacteria)]|uniref:hypothetical protein n=1 Tax=Ponticoccus sp. (in: a-proteobacteria) TaxID=1925025 RepID=UPI003AB16442
MRDFYRCNFDVGNVRDVVSFGPSWLKNEFYGEDLGPSENGPLDMELAELAFDDSQSLPVADFNNVMMLPSCSEEIYTCHLAELIHDWVVIFPCKIEGERHILFRPKRFFDLVDLNRSRYLARPSRGPYAFKEVAIKAEPPLEVPIFALDPPRSLKFEIFVDSRFRNIVAERNLSGFLFQKVSPPIRPN